MQYIEPIHLSHHLEGQEHLCFKRNNRFYCRRCFTMYPVAFITAVYAYMYSYEMSWLLLFSLPTLATIENILLTFNKIKYVSSRATIFAVLKGFAFGSGVALMWSNSFHPKFWFPSIIFGFIWFSVWYIAFKKKTTVQQLP